MVRSARSRFGSRGISSKRSVAPEDPRGRPLDDRPARRGYPGDAEGRTKSRPDPLDLIPPGGRLLVYFPDEDLSDGAAEAESGGFFDVNNTPPWDTWIALIRHDSGDPSAGDILFSWVPEPFVRRADRGIGVNPEGCIEWLAQSGLPIAARIRAGVAFR